MLIFAGGINGDGTIRLIYDGTTCHENGIGTIDSIAVTSQTYNSQHTKSEYAGYTYAEGNQRGTTNASNLKVQTDDWYKTNITDKGYDVKVATGKFCNDRNTASGSTWSSQPSSTFKYAVYGRLVSAKKPTLNCSNVNDIYDLKVGAITADEVAFAGGVYGKANSSYYLYNAQHYWTMSPYSWDGASAVVFSVSFDGKFTGTGVDSAGIGVRPVINLRSDVTFSNGNGTIDAPYEVL